MGRIYKVCSENTEKTFVGTTTRQLGSVLKEFQRNYKQHINGRFDSAISVLEVLSVGGEYIELLEEVETSDHTEMAKIAEGYVKKEKECVNRRVGYKSKGSGKNDTKVTKQK